MISAQFSKRIFHFKNPSGTSRGILTEKLSWFIELTDGKQKGIGECSIIEGLSPDFVNESNYESKLKFVVNQINGGQLNLENAPSLLIDFPSILFGIETAFLDLKNGGNQIIFKNDFSLGKRNIPINGLIWMGTEEFMKSQIDQKISEGFSTLKMKIGAIDFETEFKLLQSIREKYNSDLMTLRVDANGSFSAEKAPEILERLATLEIHSIEQPIAVGQLDQMRKLCATTRTPIALDEELIGINSTAEKKALLSTIKPQYIILKPSLHGGISSCREWISIAESHQIPWWMTSALESNIGLNAICQFVGEYENQLPQGLGTGGLYVDNINSNLYLEQGYILQKL